VKNAVVLYNYETGVVKADVTTGFTGTLLANFNSPRGVSFTADGDHILVADCANHRVSKFSTSSGKFIAHVATAESCGILWPKEALQVGDNSLLVVTGVFGSTGIISSSLLLVAADGVTSRKIFIEGSVSASGSSLSFSPCSGYVAVKNHLGQVCLLQDAWMSSSRCAWLSALCTGISDSI
jgi:hypothetical protein